MGRNMMNCVMISEIIAIVSDTKEAIQITNWEVFGDNFDKESPSINSCNIWPVKPTDATESSINNSKTDRSGKNPKSSIPPALIFIINHGKTMCEIPKMIWLMITSDLNRQ